MSSLTHVFLTRELSDETLEAVRVYVECFSRDRYGYEYGRDRVTIYFRDPLDAKMLAEEFPTIVRLQRDFS